MQKTLLNLEEIKLMGPEVRTNNRDELYSENYASGKIFPCVQRYFGERLFEKIPRRKNPGRTFCVYTEYESDHTGQYTYFIGEEVDAFSGVPEGLSTLIIEPQSYVRFTTKPGPMPSVLRDAWLEILNMTKEDLGGQRRYHADFEIYDERAQDPNNLVLDIYLGIC